MPITIKDSLPKEYASVIIEIDSDGIKAARSIDGQIALYYATDNADVMLATEKKVLWKAGFYDAVPIEPGTWELFRPNGNHETQDRINLSLSEWTGTKSDALHLLKNCIMKSMGYLKGKSCGVLFSGGVDSSLIAHLAKDVCKETLLLSAFVEGSRDSKVAPDSANRLGLDLVAESVSMDDIWDSLPKVIYAIETTNRMDVEIALPFFFATRKAPELGLDYVISGQGPDELFAGYARHVRLFEEKGAEALGNALLRDVSMTHEANIARDERAVSINGVRLAFPYLFPEFIQLALSLPSSWKVNPRSEIERKVIFRDLAKRLGVPVEIAHAPKKATQFSTGVSKGLIDAISYNVRACKKMTRKEVKTVVQDVLDAIGKELGVPNTLVKQTESWD